MNTVHLSPAIEESLLGKGLISQDQMRIARLEQEKSGQALGRLLVDLGFVSEAALRDALSENQGEESIDLSNIVADAAALRMIPRAVAARHHLLPLAFDAAALRLTIAIADASDLVAIDRAKAHLPPSCRLQLLLAGETEIARAIDRSYGYELSIDGILNEIEKGETSPSLQLLANDTYDQPVVRLIDAIVADAVKRNASDLHFEPEAAFLRIRYRIDGMLRQIRVLHRSCWPAMAVRLKVMGKMNIAETRAAQDGSFQLALNGRKVDFRIAAQPTIHGENIVLRILDRQRGILPLERLGLAEAHRELLLKMIARPEGIILVTGPTGSGKTTTLYSLLNHLNTESVNIMTLEDPVEYPLPMLRQTAVTEAARVDFANGIRSLMRQDPDIIFVGEIRDGETAAMAIQAAMTGHQVYSTLHSNSAVAAIPRLIDIGVRAGMLAGNIIGIVAQRLLRRLCPHCRRRTAASPAECRLLGLPADATGVETFQPCGCERCEFQGYRGRLAIMEMLCVDGEMDELIASGGNPREIRRLARTSGFRSLAEDGLRLVVDGSTSLAELRRVADLGDRM